MTTYHVPEVQRAPVHTPLGFRAGRALLDVDAVADALGEDLAAGSQGGGGAACGEGGEEGEEEERKGVGVHGSLVRMKWEEGETEE